jgi:hypothetical protein
MEDYLSHLSEHNKNQAKIILGNFSNEDINKALPPPVEGEIRHYKDGDYKFVDGHWKKLALLIAEEQKKKEKEPIPEPEFDESKVIPKKEPKTEKTFLSHIIVSSLKEGGRIRDFNFIDEDKMQAEFIFIDRINKNKLVYRKTKIKDIKVEKYPPKSQDLENVVIGRTEQDLTKFFESHQNYYNKILNRIKDYYQEYIQNRVESPTLNTINIMNTILYKFGTKDAETFLDTETFNKSLIIEENVNIIQELNKAMIPTEGEVREYKDGTYKYMDGHWKKQIKSLQLIVNNKPKEGEKREFKDGTYHFIDGSWKKMEKPLPEPTVNNLKEKLKENEPIEYEDKEYFLKQVTENNIIVNITPEREGEMSANSIRENKIIDKKDFHKIKMVLPITLSYQEEIYKQGEKVSYINRGEFEEGYIKGFIYPDVIFVWNKTNNAALKIGVNKIKKV